MGCEREKERPEEQTKRRKGVGDLEKRRGANREIGHSQICPYEIRVSESFHIGCIAWLTLKGRR